MRLFPPRRNDSAERVRCSDGSVRYRYSAEHLALLVPDDSAIISGSARADAPSADVGETGDSGPQSLLETYARELEQHARLARDRYRRALLAYNEAPCDPGREHALDRARRYDTALGDLAVDLLTFRQALHGGAVSLAQTERWLRNFPRRLAQSDPEQALAIDVRRAAAQAQEWQVPPA